MDKVAIDELEQIEAKLNELMPRVGKHKVRQLVQLVAKYYARRWKQKSRKTMKYGTLNKGFNQLELEAFLKSIDNPKYRLLFKFQAYLGLRIGEAVRVNIRNINLQSREIIIHTEKARVINTLILPMSLYSEMMLYLEENKEAISQADGYLFYADKNKSRTPEPYLNLGYVRKVFRQYTKQVNLDEVYANSDETDLSRPARQLHRLTTHSLRHYAITTFSRKTNGNLVLTSRYARHQNPNTTLTYINSDKTELYSAIEQMIDSTHHL